MPFTARRLAFLAQTPVSAPAVAARARTAVPWLLSPLSTSCQNTSAMPLLLRTTRYFAAASTSSSRAYHSLDRPAEPALRAGFSPDEQAILTAAYRHVPDHGFSDCTLALGAHDAGYPAISTAILPDGVFSLVRWHLVAQRSCLAARSCDLFGEPNTITTAAAAAALPPADIAARAERLTWERLLGNKDVAARWQEALAIMAQPAYVPAALHELALLVDEIWALASDTAVDPSWYAKRASLSAVYAASELFMTTDTSPDFAATRDFLHRRFLGANALGGYVHAIGQWAGFTASAGVNVLRSKGVPI